LAALIVLTLSPLNVEAKIDIIPYVKFLIRQEAVKQNADPNFCLAVAHIESRIGNQELRIGRLGNSRYYGPFGINKCFLARWPIDRLDINIRVGVNALRGGFKSLRRYNANCTHSYLAAVRQAYRKYQREEQGNGWE
jgi:hypothetical protein